MGGTINTSYIGTNYGIIRRLGNSNGTFNLYKLTFLSTILYFSCPEITPGKV